MTKDNKGKDFTPIIVRDITGTAYISSVMGVATKEEIKAIPKASDINIRDGKHKQARGYLKTTSRLVGKDTTQRSLFEIPHFDTAINPYKESLSKMTAITGNLLLSLWQANKNDKEIYVIDNLTSVARVINASPQELKLYLIYLGGYQRPITELRIIKEKGKKDKRILSIYHDKLFHIKFNIRLADNETADSFNNDARIGTQYLNFIKDRDIDSIEVMPSTKIQEELLGRGLGNVLVDDNFVAFSLGLSDLAYKLFCFSGSNRPSFKIGFDKLIGEKYLNLNKQIKAQGKPRELKKIQEALKELLNNGHLIKWGYNKAKDMFSWTYSSKIIKHKDFITPKQSETLKIKAPKPTGQDTQL